MRLHRFLVLIIALLIAGCNTSKKTDFGVNNNNAQTSNKPAEISVNENAVSQARYNIHFLPITGAPANKVSTLSKALQSAALQKKIALVKANQNESYRVKGFFSAFNDGNGTLVVYVWDVLDANNQRKHRINGQRKITKSARNSWQVVNDQTMHEIGQTSIQQLDSWISKQK